MINRGMGFSLFTALLISSCTPIPATQQGSPLTAETERTAAPSETASVVPPAQMPQTPEVLFTIPNPEPFSGREGEPRPDWLGWGAETFAFAPDGTLWIADTAVSPNRLLHYSPQDQLLSQIPLTDLVVHAYDLAWTQDSLWVLDVSAQSPRIVQLDGEGELKGNIDIPREIMTQGGFISNGAFDLSVGDEGELLLDSVNGYYEMVDASGSTVTARRLDALEYYGHTYQTGPYNQATGRLPIIVDGRRLETSPDFFVEMPLLGFTSDGSFAVAGSVESPAGEVDHQVRYYSATGELLGTARQRPQTFYKDWNHHLAVASDGSVYQLLSNPDHSIQILRLGFSEELPAPVEPAPTPTPLTVLQPPETATTDEEQARNTLLSFFAGLGAGNFEQAAGYFGGEKVEYARERMPGETVGEYWESICTTALWCLPVAGITDTAQVSDEEFVFYVVFVHPDGSRFEIGACCGGDPAASPPVWQFAYPVRRIDGQWKVMRDPMFTP